MTGNKTRWALGLYWIPFCVGLVSACVYIYFLVSEWGGMGAGIRVTLIMGLVIGVLAIVQAVLAAADSRVLTDMKREEKALRDRLAQAHGQSKQLSSHLEVLTAMREVTRILSDAVDLKHIANKVFDVLEPLLGADEIALILKEAQGGLELKALRRGGETFYGDELAGAEVELDDAAQALEHQTLVKSVDGSTGTFCVPLVADQAAVGVMRFEIQLEGSAAEKESKIDELELILTDIAKHLALVVKTPSLHDRAIIDGLTGLFTRRHFDIRIDDMFRLARRYGTPFALVLLDVDHFKEVNDTYGHPAGDTVLREAAGVITTAIRDCDSAFRYGGEEFAILLPETTAEQACHIAERLRAMVGHHAVKTKEGDVSVTLSLGVTEYNPDLANYGELIVLADQALYRAKQAGRNRTVVNAGSSREQAGQEAGADGPEA